MFNGHKGDGDPEGDHENGEGDSIASKGQCSVLKGEPEGTNEDMDASRKRKTTLDVWEHFTMKKVEGNLKSNAIIVASFTWMSLAKVHPICVII